MHRPLAGPKPLLVAVLVGLVVHAAHYYPFFSDDALITLRYARRLCEGHGLTWTDGPRVEGYTDLLWVLLNAPATCLGLDPMWSARVLAFVGAALAVVVTGLSADAPRLSSERLASGGVLLAAAAPIAVWSVGGLEHGFMFGVLALGLRETMRTTPSPSDVVRAACFFGGLVLLRADGLVLFIAASAGWWLSRPAAGRGVRGVLRWFAVPVGLWLAQLTFRLAYYGEWVPNTARAKVAFSSYRLLQGLGHLRDGFIPLIPFVLAAAAAAALLWKHGERRQVLVPTSVAVGWSAYVALVGGDIFPGWRQLAFVLIPMGLLVAHGVSHVRRWDGASPGAIAVAWGALIMLALHLQMRNSENRRARNELWEWDGLPIGTLLHTAFGEQRPLLAVDAAGALPYWSRLPSLDMLGLNDPYLPRHPPPRFGSGSIGHELGDGAYVLRREPDIIAFCGSRGSRTPCFLSGHQMMQRPEFHEHYQFVRVTRDPVHGPIGELYLRREGVLGVQRRPHGVTIPGYLFAQGPAIATLSEEQLVTPVVPGIPAELMGLRVDAGRWALSFEAGGEPYVVAIACNGVSAQARPAGAGHVIELQVPMRIDIRVEGKSHASLPLRRATLAGEEGEAAGLFCAARHAEHMLSVSLDELASDVPIGAHWATPAARVFGRAGLEVRLPRVFAPTAIELVADGNDRYTVSFLNGRTRVGQVQVPAQAGIGMQRRRVNVDGKIAAAGADSMTIHAVGDGYYSLGRLHLEESSEESPRD